PRLRAADPGQDQGDRALHPLPGAQRRRLPLRARRQAERLPAPGDLREGVLSNRDVAKEKMSISDVVERGGELEKRVLTAQAAILKTALPAGVQVSFGEGRRASDVCLVLLKGEREAVLPLPTAIEDLLEFDLHVVRSTHSRGVFELLLVLMEPLEGQSLRSPERRSALRRRLALIAADPEAASLLEVGGEQEQDERPNPEGEATAGESG